MKGDGSGDAQEVDGEDASDDEDDGTITRSIEEDLHRRLT